VKYRKGQWYQFSENSGCYGFNAGDIVEITVDGDTPLYKSINDSSLECCGHASSIDLVKDDYLKIGSRVKIIAQKYGHDFDIGQIVVIDKLAKDIFDDYGAHDIGKNTGQSWYLRRDEFETVDEEKITISIDARKDSGITEKLNEVYNVGGKGMSDETIVGKIEDLELDSDERLFRKFGITDNCGKLTRQGEIILLRLLFKENKAKVVEKLKQLEKEEKADKKS
jgi:hypothetical protein